MEVARFSRKLGATETGTGVPDAYWKQRQMKLRGGCEETLTAYLTLADSFRLKCVILVR